MQEFQVNDYRETVNTSPVSVTMLKVYLWLGLGILVSGFVSLGYPYLLAYLSTIVSIDTLSTIYLASIIVSFIVMIPSLIIVSFKAFRPKSIVTNICYILYTIAMGVLLSSLVADFLGTQEGMSTLCVSFFVTALCFIVMGLIGTFTKADLGPIMPIALTAIIGCVVISLVNILLKSALVYWIIDFVCFGVMLLVTAFDFNRVKLLATSRGFEDETNLAIYCAFNLYVDFIYIFIHVLRYVAMFRNRN